MNRILQVLAAATLAASAMSLPLAAGATYPEREIKLGVGYGAGGVGDVSARLLAKSMEKELKHPIIVLNRPGAQATLNPAQLARLEPDGYNVGVLTFAPMAIVPHMLPVTYTAKDFIFAGAFGRFQYGLAVRADSPYKTVKDLVEAAKVKPIFFGAPGAPNNIALYELGRKSGARFEQVLYKSGNDTVLSLIAGQTEVIIQTPSEIMPHVQSGKLRLLASVSPARWPDRPDMPTVKESGYDVEIESWMGLAVPKGTPAPIVERLQGAMMTAMKDKDVLDGFKRMGLDAVTMTGPEYARMIDEGYVAMGKALKEAGLTGKQP
ncbi:Bug family tripartite tricarboxylate transporter substrate binding protein [Comamonas endophytica]|uniref:Tripartite tricarboxylate transporter substrate binding protein n=1 Tax=Comamonas endophytica TaxID=2949090 RepID=A0ABY6GDX2_9BURK|nr:MULTISPECIES: tripartite tricarboxylate transporter substrate binding protein [unclassified Acidovorax]MCD2512529.1 tripartite tricarboxylate transporter substrate binding protein [Acidovorax sp. D4N7]UYG53106.1 tripartite tricarboxylate transporter substrate binding protein [Acidovorax sp. 5MLIR]